VGNAPCRRDVDEWYEPGERGGPALLLTPFLQGSLSSAGCTGSTVHRSALVVLANMYQGRIGQARNSAAEIACGDIIETD
jgi:hypothetical protein